VSYVILSVGLCIVGVAVGMLVGEWDLLKWEV
jgi:hypothetical protein